MDFIPESLEALGELAPDLDDGELSDLLQRKAAQAQAVVPDLAGISLAYRAHGLTFTLVASDAEIALLDAVQYLDAGPCVDALDHARGVATTEGGLMAEEQWHALAVTSAAAGIRSTLTFPIRDQDVVVGTINLYGRSEDSFVGKHHALAETLNAWAPGAVTNADLAFATRDTAREAPARLRSDSLVDTATGIVAATRNITLDGAREALDDAARRAGVPVTRIAEAVLHLHQQE